MSENDKFTEENTEQTLPAESETALIESETAVAPAEEAPEEEEEIAPEDVKIFGMPRHVFHWTALGAAGGYILAGIIGGKCRKSAMETVNFCNHRRKVQCDRLGRCCGRCRLFLQLPRRKEAQGRRGSREKRSRTVKMKRKAAEHTDSAAFCHPDTEKERNYADF